MSSASDSTRPALRGALSGVRVVELSSGVPAALCCKILAGLGAQVVKVEPPGDGSAIRRLGPFPGDTPNSETGVVHLFADTSKLSVTLDWRAPAGADLLVRLLDDADALVEDVPPAEKDAAHSLFDRVARMESRLVWTAVTPFGQTGPYRDLRMTDLTLAALSGWLFQTGEPGQEPLKAQGHLAEGCVAGAVAAIGVLAALFRRGMSGAGQRLDVSCMESLISADRFLETTYDYTGYMTSRMGNRLPNTYPYTIYPCRDGHVAAICITDAQWESLCQMVGMPELLGDPRFTINRDRFQNADALGALLMPWFEQRTAQECFDAGQLWRIPFSKVNSMADLLAMEQLHSRGYFESVKHPVAGEMRYPGPAIRFTASPWRAASAAPTLGQHNEQVYCSRLGLSRADLAGLRRQGVV